MSERLKTLPKIATDKTTVEDGEEGAEDVGEAGWARERRLLEIEEALLKALNEVGMVEQELEMLQMREKMAGAAPPRDAAGRVGPAMAGMGMGRGGGGGVHSKRVHDTRRQTPAKNKITSVHIPKTNSLAAAYQAPQVGRGRVMVPSCISDRGVS